jgi:two-component system sensor histidine kinase EvgS
MTLSLTTLEPLDAVRLQRDPPAHTSPLLNILVVDDHPANRLLLCQQLEFLGHHCEVAQNGATALQSWLANPFDVVIAD